MSLIEPPLVMKPLRIQSHIASDQDKSSLHFLLDVITDQDNNIQFVNI